MSRPRLIARLDIKGPKLIKGVHLEGVRVIGAPNEYALRYYQEGADELLYMDAVASLYGRNSLSDVVKDTASNVFIPLTVGGGLRSVGDVEKMLHAGADKIAINTAAIQDPTLLTKIAKAFGSQCVVLQIDAKRTSKTSWEAYIDGGREKTGIDVVQWVKKGQDLGAGEILLTSIDQEGTRKGMDLDLIKTVTNLASIPVISSGGIGKIEDASDAFIKGQADAIAAADILHYKRASIANMRSHIHAQGIPVRSVVTS